jgi:hypothetical protein
VLVNCEAIEKGKRMAGKARRGHVYEGVAILIIENYDKLSDGHQQASRFFTQHPNVIALESINAIAAKFGVHPSVL